MLGADLLVLLDEDLALAVGDVDVLHLAAGLVAHGGGHALVEGQRGGAGELLRHEREEALAEPGALEGADELGEDRAVGPRPSARGAPGRARRTRASSGGWPTRRTRNDAARLLLPGQRAGAEHAVADQRARTPRPGGGGRP